MPNRHLQQAARPHLHLRAGEEGIGEEKTLGKELEVDNSREEEEKRAGVVTASR